MTDRDGKATRNQIARVAAVQLDYQPAVSLAHSYYDEPALLEDGEEGVTSLHLSVPELRERLTALRSRTSDAYVSYSRDRVEVVLKMLRKHDVEVVVFPEYCVPWQCLDTIREHAGEMVVVAASHTATADSMQTYQDLGIPLGATDIGCSVCPVRLGDGSWQVVQKLSRSRFEGSLKVGTKWERLRIETRSGASLTLAVFLCVDFLNDQDPNVQRLVPRSAIGGADVVCVPSYSPTLRDFQHRARALVERSGCPVIYSNVASVGGTQIFCRFRTRDSFVDSHGTKPVSRDDEALIVVDLPVGPCAQYELRPSPLPESPASDLVVALPLLSRDRFKDFCNLAERVIGESAGEQKRAILHNTREELMALTSPRAAAPALLTTKIYALLDAMTWRDAAWIDRAVECAVVDGPNQSLADVRFALLFRAQETLARLLRDPRVQRERLQDVAVVLDTYRIALDALRSRVSVALLRTTDAADLSVHKIDGGQASERGAFASSFLMQLRSARTHRDSLEKQIRLLATLAHATDDELAINLRIRSLPNPGGNLKDLEIQIFGTVSGQTAESARTRASEFRRDLSNIILATLRDSYGFRVVDIDSEDLARSAQPYKVSHAAELHRRVEFGRPPYLSGEAAPRIHHLEGNSSMARILDTLQASASACTVSIHLEPVRLTEAERAFFEACRQPASLSGEDLQGSMFFLGTEANPALRMNDAITTKRMLGDGQGLRPNFEMRLFVASDQPLSRILLSSIGNELWGDAQYALVDLDDKKDALRFVEDALARAWARDVPKLDGAPQGLERVAYLLDTYEASRAFRLPLSGYAGAVRTLFAYLPAPAASLPEEGIEIGLGFHSGAQRSIVVRLPDEERTKHTYVVGKTGTGKSTLLCRMIEQDILRGSGVCVIDPHGDLVDAVLTRIPEERIDDVVLLDPAVTDRPFGLNLLEFNPSAPHHKDFVVQETIAIMRKMFFHEHVGPVFEHSLRHLVLTVMDESFNGEGTLIEVPRLLYDQKYRCRVVPLLRDELAREYWAQYGLLVQHTISESLMYVVSKFDTFTADRIMRNIIGQARSTINIADIMERGQILLVKLPSAVFGELNSALLGMILLSKLRWAGMRRANVPAADRRAYFLYVDEFQNFAASGFETILAEARKYGLSLIVSHQHLGQLSAFNVATGAVEDRVTKAVFGNAGTMIAFRLGISDATLIAAEMGEPADPNDLVNLKNYHALVKTLIGGEVCPPFTIRTTLGKSRSPSFESKIRTASSGTFGTPREEVETEIRRRKNSPADAPPPD
jgi:predicted amidohydrolase